MMSISESNETSMLYMCAFLTSFHITVVVLYCISNLCTKVNGAYTLIELANISALHTQKNFHIKKIINYSILNKTSILSRIKGAESRIYFRDKFDY